MQEWPMDWWLANRWVQFFKVSAMACTILVVCPEELG
jgi:hypothetical protein